MRKLLFIASLLVASFALAQNDNDDRTILQGLAEESDFSTLISLLEQSGLAETLGAEGPFTVFAPHNGAFDELNASVLEQLQADPALLEQVLLGHVVEGVYGINDLQDAEDGSISSLQGEALTFDLSVGGMDINNAEISSTNVGNNYTNGVVHVVGDVVIPVSLAGTLGADETDTAAEVSDEDAENADMAEGGTLVSTLQNDERFSTLVSLLEQAGLVETLSGEGPFTVFAPTNAAFEALPAEQLEAVQADPALLERVLTYHVVEGNVMSSDVTDGAVMTLEGGELNASTGDSVMFNDATVTEPDIEAANGTVHVIDRVLLPEDLR